jgi:hypothetical protein
MRNQAKEQTDQGLRPAGQLKPLLIAGRLELGFLHNLRMAPFPGSKNALSC